VGVCVVAAASTAAARRVRSAVVGGAAVAAGWSGVACVSLVVVAAVGIWAAVIACPWTRVARRHCVCDCGGVDARDCRWTRAGR
jgi:hypothetical protein